MHGLNPVAKSAACPDAKPAACQGSPRVVAGLSSSTPAIAAPACARWARAQGLGAGDTVALLVRDPGAATALRLGLASAGIRAVSLDASGGEGLVDRLAAAGAAVAIVDVELSAAYAGILGRLDAYPAVWWNGADADFARLDLALAEYA